MFRIDLNLAENALDFFFEGITYLDEQKPLKLKYAILHIASAVELILKARLAEEHWALIFKDPSKATLENLQKGEFRSVDFQEVQDRVENICKIDLSKHKSILSKLRDIRNKIQHFTFSGQVPEISSILIKTWSFLWDFIHDQLPEQMDEHQDIIERIKDHMIKHETYVLHRSTEIEPTLEAFRKSENLIVNCPSCLQESLVIPGGENPSCYFCRYQKESAEVADDWAIVFIGYPHTDPKDRMVEPVLKECFCCGMETMINLEEHFGGSMFPNDPAWICFSCGEYGHPTNICKSCGEEFPWEPEVYLCPECQGKNILDS